MDLEVMVCILKLKKQSANSISEGLGWNLNSSCPTKLPSTNEVAGHGPHFE